MKSYREIEVLDIANEIFEIEQVLEDLHVDYLTTGKFKFLKKMTYYISYVNYLKALEVQGEMSFEAIWNDKN